ncbi:MAG TPA: type 4a pilus biogenesis protein PilO [Fimbriimonadaceae bacterium]|nr:type 4a pilus biogenesis protein PilO [Fimbriimonadaceae bacterium]
MISFKTQKDILSATLMILGIILIVGGLGWYLLLKLPDSRTIMSRPANLAKLDSDIQAANKDAAQIQADVNTMVWNEGADQVEPQAMAEINKLTAAHHLKVNSFRPQKANDVVGMSEIPFGLTVNGTYLDVLSFLSDLDKSNGKLAVELVQINTAEAASDQVTGTIDFVAYLKAAPAPAAPAKGGKRV